LITLYKKDSKFFIIMVTSDNPLDESCINLLNLQN
jgi:hypothetical protein